MLPRERPAGAGLAGLVRRERTPVAEGRVIGVPVMTGVELLGVIELHAPTEMPVSELMMDTLTGIGYEVGQFLSHRRGELEPHGLTARELEVLQLAARGNSGPEIAARLFVSPATVKTHFENIYAKLHVSDRAAAVAYALRMGLID
jgi:DNA-binding NarL/FixJ family response regulator